MGAEGMIQWRKEKGQYWRGELLERCPGVGQGRDWPQSRPLAGVGTDAERGRAVRRPMEESEHLRVFSEMLEGRSPAVGMAGGDS